MRCLKITRENEKQFKQTTSKCIPSARDKRFIQIYLNRIKYQGSKRQMFKDGEYRNEMKSTQETHLRNQTPSPEAKEIPIYPKSQIHVFSSHTINSGCINGNKKCSFEGQGLGGSFTFQDLS